MKKIMDCQWSDIELQKDRAIQKEYFIIINVIVVYKKDKVPNTERWKGNITHSLCQWKEKA